jgi:hypothetical protein
MATFTYTDVKLTNITYSTGATKTFSYTGDTLSSIVLVECAETTTRTFNYTDGVLTSITES